MRLHFVGVEDLGQFLDLNQCAIRCHSFPLFAVVSGQLSVLSDSLSAAVVVTDH